MHTIPETVMSGLISLLLLRQCSFKIVRDVGRLVVPTDYDSSRALASICTGATPHNKHITDLNFPNPSTVLESGDVLDVVLCSQADYGTTTAQNRVDFILQVGGVLVGAQGLVLCSSELSWNLDIGRPYPSLDRKERLWVDYDGRHRVPALTTSNAGGSVIGLSYFDVGFGLYDEFLLFLKAQP